MSIQAKYVHQNFVEHDQPPIQTRIMLESVLTEELLDEFLASAASPTSAQLVKLGLSPAYSSSSVLLALAFATTSQVLIVQFHNRTKSTSAKAYRQLLQAKVLAACQLFAFDIGPLAAALFLDHGLKLTSGVDIQSACSGGGDETPLAAIQFAMGDRIPVYAENVRAAFVESPWDPARTTPLALRAWIAAFMPTISDMEERFAGVKRVNTVALNETYLETIARMARNDQQLAAKRPAFVGHEFNSALAHHDKLKLKSSRFQNRIQKTSDMLVTVQDDETGAQYQLHGRTVDISGPDATLRTQGSLQGKTVTSLTTVGGERITNAERQKSIAILRALQGEDDLNSPFLSYIMFPSETLFTWPESFESSDSIPPILADRLNDSQHAAVEHMLSVTDSTRVTIIQGPPGTGKTSVIAAYVLSAIAAERTGIWLVAQTNVAVKNIAEKLADIGFINWKILVSADFHMGWHEHLYKKINKNIIRSDEFHRAERQLEDCSVVLCTLSMLANPRIKNFIHIVPINTLVVDEASQIAVQDYIPVLSLFSTIQKMCFIGDDKQLPPYGQDDIDDLKSVFEIPHLRVSALLLNIQYRMPPHIGDFISQEVYNAELFSNPKHPVEKCSVIFFDIEDGYEEHYGTSWMNSNECKRVIQIASKLQDENRSYRIITPYDPQRNLLESEMKTQGLKWQDKVFNVDSFQGNEDDYIVISLVRSKELGFLTDLRRTNVMLTRCKRGMYICSSWNFIQGIAHNTLMGKMASVFGEDMWRGLSDIESEEF